MYRRSSIVEGEESSLHRQRHTALSRAQIEGVAVDLRTAGIGRNDCQLVEVAWDAQVGAHLHDDAGFLAVLAATSCQEHAQGQQQAHDRGTMPHHLVGIPAVSLHVPQNGVVPPSRVSRTPATTPPAITAPAAVQNHQRP